MKRLKILIAATVVLFGIGSTALLTASAAADSPTSVVCTTIDPGSSNCSATPKGSLDINKVIKAIINILSTIVGIASVIMIIIGGFRFITAAGDSSRVASARSSIIYALVGIAIVVLAQSLVKFVLNKATS